MSTTWTTTPAAEVRVGDRVRIKDLELTVTRIDSRFFGIDDFLAFVEDSDDQWIKVPARTEAPVEVAQR